MKSAALTCSACHGTMTAYTGPKYNKNVCLFMIISGIFCILFWIGAVLGIPLLILGIFMASSKRKLWVCKDCNIAIERIEFVTSENIVNKNTESEKEIKNITNKVANSSDI